MSDAEPLSTNPAALDFLLTRRSRPPRVLGAVGPTRDALMPILTAGLRVPDHGKLEPWRLIVLQDAARLRLAALTIERGMELGIDKARLEKAANGFRDTPVIVAVVASPKASETIPEQEQRASASAVCLSVTNAALAAGWGASWLTGWMASDGAFLRQGLGLFPHENVAGFIHIGEEQRVPPERPRPNLDACVTWMSE